MIRLRMRLTFNLDRERRIAATDAVRDRASILEGSWTEDRCINGQLITCNHLPVTCVMPNDDSRLWICIGSASDRGSEIVILRLRIQSQVSRFI